MSSEPLFWEYKGLNIEYSRELDGDGRSMATMFVEFIKDNYKDKLPFDCCYEWCSGPGFIGFALLAENICKHLVLADINPKAVDVAKRTIKQNGLSDKVSVYLSDNLKEIPKKHKFDLVVSNPPNYYCLNPLHPSYESLSGDLRPNDPVWKIHKEFYRTIGEFLNEDAVLCIEEVDPFATKCFMPNTDENKPLWGPEPFDLRPRPPIIDFREMINAAGLTFDRVVKLPEPTVPVHLVVSTYQANNDIHQKLIKRPNYEFLERIGELESGAYRVYAHEGERLRGAVDLKEEQLWLLDLLELLTISGDSGIGITAVCEKLELTLAEVESAKAMLKNMGWII